MRGRASAGTAAIFLVSAAGHLAVLSWLALTRSELRSPYPGPQAVRLDIRPAYLPPRRPAADAPARLRQLRPRASRRSDEAAGAIPPLLLPPPPAAAETTAVAPAPPDLGAMLRGGVGCDERARLTVEDRERCAERLGARRSEGPDYGPAAAIARAKRAAFDRAAGLSTLPPEPPGVAPEGSDNMGDPDYGGGMADNMGRPHSGSRRATRVTPRLPP